jgi:hypothetical protein
MIAPNWLLISRPIATGIDFIDELAFDLHFSSSKFTTLLKLGHVACKFHSTVTKIYEVHSIVAIEVIIIFVYLVYFLSTN